MSPSGRWRMDDLLQRARGHLPPDAYVATPLTVRCPLYDSLTGGRAEIRTLRAGTMFYMITAGVEWMWGYASVVDGIYADPGWLRASCFQ